MGFSRRNVMCPSSPAIAGKKEKTTIGSRGLPGDGLGSPESARGSGRAGATPRHRVGRAIALARATPIKTPIRPSGAAAVFWHGELQPGGNRPAKRKKTRPAEACCRKQRQKNNQQTAGVELQIDFFFFPPTPPPRIIVKRGTSPGPSEFFGPGLLPSPVHGAPAPPAWRRGKSVARMPLKKWLGPSKRRASSVVRAR